VKELAISPDGNVIACAVREERRGGTTLLYARLPPAESDETAELRTVCVAAENVAAIDFLDEVNLLVNLVDRRKLDIPLEGEVGYGVGVRSLDPAQLEMLGLDRRLADRDEIWRFRLGTEERHRWCGGHDVTIGSSGPLTPR
jgi:hypothetical protein